MSRRKVRELKSAFSALYEHANFSRENKEPLLFTSLNSPVDLMNLKFSVNFAVQLSALSDLLCTSTQWRRKFSNTTLLIVSLKNAFRSIRVSGGN